MPDYQNGKIYKIESYVGNCVYYGSTTLKYLCDRFASHRYKYKIGIRHSVSEVLQYPDAKIYLVEIYPCNSKNELTAKEGYYIKNYNCVNKNIPDRTPEQYRLDNKEKITIQNKQYRLDNKEKISIQQNQQFMCECGKTYTRSHKSHHTRSTHHKKYMNNPMYKIAL